MISQITGLVKVVRKGVLVKARDGLKERVKVFNAGTAANKDIRHGNVQCQANSMAA